MGQIKYSYCVDENDELVHINSLSDSTRHARKLFCLQCGQEMIANLGKKKSWYFSHKSDCACDGESYLHKLGKRRIREKFMSESKFPLLLLKDVPCSEKGKCSFYAEGWCSTHDYKICFDLKYWNNSILYDTCQEEVYIKINEKEREYFRPDLLLTCSFKPDRKPVFIEIFKTNESNESKITSNYRIIETKRIDSEKDIEDIVERGFIEGENCKTYNFNPRLPSIRKTDIPIDRFVLFKNGAAKVYKAIYDEVHCDMINKKMHSNSRVELNMIDQGIDIWADKVIDDSLDSYQTGLLYLVKKGMNIRNCILCNFYKYNDYFDSYMCILYKSLGLQDRFPKQSTANECQRYELNQQLMRHPLDEIEKVVFELPTNQ